MPIRIDKDGTIINDGEERQSSGNTIIREDGTIETRIGSGSTSSPRRYVAAPPVSPLENGNQQNRTVPISTPSAPSPAPLAGNRKNLADLEYDLMVKRGQIKGATPKTAIIVACVFLVIALLFQNIIFAIPSGIAAIFIISGLSKKNQYTQELEAIQKEIDNQRR